MLGRSQIMKTFEQRHFVNTFLLPKSKFNSSSRTSDLLKVGAQMRSDTWAPGGVSGLCYYDSVLIIHFFFSF